MGTMKPVIISRKVARLVLKRSGDGQKPVEVEGSLQEWLDRTPETPDSRPSDH